jgi:hypothetical protein
MVALDQLIAVDAADLVATAPAGVPLPELRAELARHGAWVALDASGSDRMTLGDVLASGAGGPLSAGFGLPRDQVLGLSFTTLSGAPVRTGGRVVKNVAGFDLAKLLIGSRGRFGTITEAHLRLRITPGADLTRIVSGTREQIETLTRTLMLGGVNPVCFEVLDPLLASALGLAERWTLALRAMGSSVAAREELDACAAPLHEADGSMWTTWRAVTGSWPVLVRIGTDPATWADAIGMANQLGSPLGVSVTVPRGTVRLGFATASAESIEQLRAGAAARGWPVTLERGEGDAWGTLPAGVRRIADALEASWAHAT